jgi:deoxycytidylate deaminase
MDVLPDRIQSVMRLAEHTALKCAHGGRFFYGAVLVSGGNIISVGQNFQDKTSPRSLHPYQRIHAELDCIIGVDQRHITGATMVVARRGFDSRARRMIAAPCQWCQTLIQRAQIRRVYYTISDNTVGCWEIDKGPISTAKVFILPTEIA